MSEDGRSGHRFIFFLVESEATRMGRCVTKVERARSEGRLTKLLICNNDCGEAVDFTIVWVLYRQVSKQRRRSQPNLFLVLIVVHTLVASAESSQQNDKA